MLFTSILLVGGLTAVSTSAAGTAKSGIYSIDAGKEEYHSMKEFKTLSKSEKKAFVKSKRYIVSGTYVYPINAILMTESNLNKSATTVTEFEKTNSIEFDKIYNDAVNEEFQVMDIY